MFKALHNVKYVFGIYMGGNSLVDSFHSLLGKYLKQKMTSLGLIGHIEPANHFSNGLSMKYPKMVFQSFMELKVALFMDEK